MPEHQHLSDCLVAATITAHAVARIPLTEASQAMALADSSAVHGKVVLTP